MKRLGFFLLLLAVFTVLPGCDLFGNRTTTTEAATSTTAATTATTSTFVNNTTASTTAAVTTTAAITTTAAVTTTAGVTTTAPITTTTTTATTGNPDPVAGILIDEVANLYVSVDHWYEITIDEPGLMRAYTLGDLDTFCLFYASDMTLMFTDDDTGFESNFEAESFLEAGTYYIVVRGYDEFEAGEYQIIVEFEPENEAVFLVNTATHLNPAAVDRYDFTIDQAGYLTAYTLGMTDLIGYLYDSEDSQLSGSDDDGTNYNIRFDFYVQPGEYYITVEGYDETEVGDYRMVVYVVPELAGDHYFSQDATLPAGLIHEYEIDITQAGFLKAFTLGSVDTYGQLFDSGHDLLIQIDDDGFDGNFMLEYHVTPGTYYVVVQGYDDIENGDYRLNVDFTPERTMPHMIAQEGHIDPGDEAWYDITVTELGYIIAYTESGMDTYGYLHSSEMTLLVENDDSNVDGNFLILYLAQPGTYHLMVSGYDETDQGDYRIIVDLVPAGETDSRIFFSAYGAIVGGTGGTYEITVTEPGYLTAFTVSSLDTFGSMYDSAEQLFAADDDSYSEYNFYISTYVDPGTYTFFIQGYDVETNGDYLFIVNFLPNVE